MYYPKKTIHASIKKARELNDKGVRVGFSYLAVKKGHPKKIEKEIAEYYTAIDVINHEKLDGNLTLKLHQFGIYKEKEYTHKAIETVIKKASMCGMFVWIDMEKSETVDATLEIVYDLYEKYANVGVCLQAYLKRTEHDLEVLLNNHIPIRLVKGFYKENDYTLWKEITERFKYLTLPLLLRGNRPALGTHDIRILEHAKELIRMYNLKQVELQFFTGIIDDYIYQLTREGFNTRMYIPWGNFPLFLLKGFPTFDNRRHFQRMLKRKVIT